ncbi:urea amidolyase family protein [Microbacterium panaciterrae]|uniref:5-oxoprolinase/urea amidolyase family protein n=1 Tax=Microbacterium panaciterrae TaxID=985759 RepID=A0ABP8PIW3_9MICO
MRILTASDHALLVEVDDLDEAIRRHLAWGDVPGVVELVPAARTVLVRYEPARTSAAALSARLRSWPAPEQAATAQGEVRIPVRYDGEDLPAMAELLGVSADELGARHRAARWRVAFSGFAPGFGYLVGSDPLFDVPRRATPRTRVPAGSVGLAGTFTGVYPRESPGGWQLIGRTDAVVWDADRDPPALLAPGRGVRFTLAARPRILLPGAGPTAEHGPVGAAPLRDSPRLVVAESAFPILIQDRGRPGRAALGVSGSGAADRIALRDANDAVGNPAGSPVLELTGSARLRFEGLGGGDVAAVAGADGPLLLTGADGEEHELERGVPFPLSDGDELEVGFPTRGLRCVLAVRGGFLVHPTLGSASTDTLAGLGPDPLRAGDALGIGDPHLVRTAVQPFPIARTLPAPGDVAVLRITLGPREDWFTADAVEALLGQEWEVTPHSDRVGLRLHGDTPLSRAELAELPSEGAVTGSIQVPADGQPVLFLPDHPLTGGYPVIGAVVDADLDLAGQLPPGSRIRFAVG